MKIFLKTISIMLLWAGLTATMAVFSAETNDVAASTEAKDKLPAEIKIFLESADEFILFSLNPEYDYDRKYTNTFNGYPIIGQTEINKRVVITNLVESLDKGIANANGWAKCFNPRHGIRAKKGGETAELIICFECGHVRILTSKGGKLSLATTQDPADIFNRALKAGGVPVPKKQ